MIFSVISTVLVQINKAALPQIKEDLQNLFSKHEKESFLNEQPVFSNDFFLYFRYKDRLEFYVLDVSHPEKNTEELSISVVTKYLLPFEGRWGFAYAYENQERILFVHGGFSATHNHGQTILFQIDSHSKVPVPVLVSNVQVG